MCPEDHQTYRFLKSSINALAPTPDELIENLYSICRPVDYQKGEFFLMAGDIPKNVGFNLDGIFRLFYIDNEGNELTKGFSTAGKFVISYSALAQERPSFFYIEALTNAKLLRSNYRQWMKMIEEDIRWYPFVFKLVEQVYMMKEMREKSFLLDSATERYQTFQQQFPGLEEEIKLYHIASFLGITPETLSRIRKKEKDKN